MLTHLHTRSDYPQPVSPRIPKPVRLVASTMDAHTEHKIRYWLTWGAGSCWLVSDLVLDRLARLFFTSQVTVEDIERLASPEVYEAAIVRIDEISVSMIEVRNG